MRKARLLVVILLLLIALTAGCGKKDTGDSGQDSGKILTKAEFIGMLGSSFGYEDFISDSQLVPDVPSSNEYYSNVQACAEWDVIEAGSNLDPNKDTTLAFATETAVRAIGIDRIQESGAQIDANALTDFYVNNVAAIDVSNANSKVSRATAEEIIKYAKAYRQSMVLPQRVEIEYQEGVKESQKTALLNSDMLSGVLTKASDYSVGDIIVWDPKTDNISYAARITSIEGDRFTCEPVSPEEVYSNFSFSGTFEGVITNIHTASEDVSYAANLSEEMHSYGGMSYDDGFSYTVEPLANGVSASDKGFKVSFDGESKSSGSDGSKSSAKAHGEFEIAITNVSFTGKYEHEFLRVWKPTEVSAQVNIDTVVRASIEGSVSKTIPLGSLDINVAGPFFVRLKLSANIGANGDVSLSYVTENTLQAGWKKKAGFQKSFDSASQLNFEANVALAAEATLLADVRIGFLGISASVVNAQATTGVVATAKMDGDLLDTSEPMCTDILMYVPLRWAVNQEGCLLTEISKNFKASFTVWDSTNSPFKWHFHFEALNGEIKRTAGDECTRGKGEKVVQEEVDEAEEPLDEYKIFDFEPIQFDFIILEQYKLILEPGKSANITFTEIPEGYDKNSLQYEVEDKAICSVSGGTVTGIEAGNTVIKISTKDGMFSVLIAITVNGDYSGDFDGL